MARDRAWDDRRAGAVRCIGRSFFALLFERSKPDLAAGPERISADRESRCAAAGNHATQHVPRPLGGGTDAIPVPRLISPAFQKAPTRPVERAGELGERFLDGPHRILGRFSLRAHHVSGRGARRKRPLRIGVIECTDQDVIAPAAVSLYGRRYGVATGGTDHHPYDLHIECSTKNGGIFLAERAWPYRVFPRVSQTFTFGAGSRWHRRPRPLTTRPARAISPASPLRPGEHSVRVGGRSARAPERDAQHSRRSWRLRSGWPAVSRSRRAGCACHSLSERSSTRPRR